MVQSPSTFRKMKLSNVDYVSPPQDDFRFLSQETRSGGKRKIKEIRIFNNKPVFEQIKITKL